MKLIGYKTINGIVEVVTGLHIGGSTAIIEIGGRDNPVIRNPRTREPYIPGSSLKGKMRSLLEWSDGKVNWNPGKNDHGDPHKWCKDMGCNICVVFGTSADEAELGPSRLIVRDAYLAKAFTDDMKKRNPEWTHLDITEDKSENSINRISARANPRSLERVVAGVRFDFSMSYRVFDMGGDDNGTRDEGLFNTVLEGLKLIEKDTLGGAGSRGCGQVKIMIDLGDGDLKPAAGVKPADIKTQLL